MSDTPDNKPNEPLDEHDPANLRGTIAILVAFGVLIVCAWAGAYYLLISRS